MNIKNLLGKLSIGRAGVSTGAGNIVRTGAPEDAFRSGVAEFIRKAQTEEQIAQESPQTLRRPAGNPTHTVTLVSRYKYPSAKTKKLKSEEEGGDSESIETGGLDWKYAANKQWADEQAELLHEYHIYQYKNPKTQEVLKLSVPIEEYLAQQSSSDVLPEEQDTKIDVVDDETDIESTDTESAENEKSEDDFNTPLRATSDFKLVFHATRYTSNPEINPEYQSYSTPEPPKITPTDLRAYEVMPGAYRNFNLPEDAPKSKVPTWTKDIEAPVEEVPSAYGTSFRYRFKDKTPVPTLNGEKYNLGNLLVDLEEDQKFKKDPGVIKKGDEGYDGGLNIYEYMSKPRTLKPHTDRRLIKLGEEPRYTFTLWDALGSADTPQAQKARQILEDKGVEVNPELEHFTLGSGTLVNLGGKEQGVMSEGNLLARALGYLGDENKFTQLGEKSKFEGSVEAYKPKNPERPEDIAVLEPKRKQLWNQKEASRKAAAQEYFNLMSMKPKPSKKVIETSDEPEFDAFRKLRQKARKDGQNYVDFLAMNMPNELRKFILSQPYVSHAPTGGTNSPGGRHEFEHAISTDEHIDEKLSKTIAANESLNGLQGLSADDSKLHALKLAFERNAKNAINNFGRALYGRDTSKVKAEDSTGKVYDIPVPRDGEWSKKSEEALNFVENHWLKDKFITPTPIDENGNPIDGRASDQTAITKLFNELEPQFKARGIPLDRRAVAFAYLKANGVVKPEPYKDRAAYSILTNPAHTTKSTKPIVISMGQTGDEDGEGSDERTISLYLYEPSSDTGKEIKKNALRLHPFTDNDHEIAEKLLSTGAVSRMEDAEYTVWANWLVNTIKSEKSKAREQADLKAALKEQSVKERGMGKPMRWQYPLTSRKFEVSDERNEITEFAGNLEEFVNDLKSDAGATFEPNRKMVYIMTDEKGQQKQIELPNSVPVELPAGATYPVELSELAKFSKGRLEQYGLIRAGDSIYPVAALQLLKANDKGYFTIGRKDVSSAMLEGKTPEELAEKNVIVANGEYYYAPRAARISSKLVPLVAVGGEKVALPSSQLMQRGKVGQQLLLNYASKLNGIQLTGGEIHQYPSDAENQFVSNAFTDLVSKGMPEEVAIDKAKSEFAKSKMNTVAVQALTGAAASENIQEAAKEWSGRMIDFLKDNADLQFIGAVGRAATRDVFHPEKRPSEKEIVDALKEKAANGQLPESIAQRLVGEYNLLTGYAPQQLEYIKPKLRDAFMENYDAGGTPGLPGNALHHMLMSNAPNKFNKDRKLDSEASLDMSSHGLVSVLEKPRSSHEGHMLEKVLPQSSLTMLKSLLTRDERKVQDVNPRYLTGRRNVAKNWEVTPIFRLLVNHPEWTKTEGIFPPELLEQAERLAGTKMIAKMREELVPESVKYDDDGREHVDMAVALDVLLHRKIEEVDKKPHVDLWDIMLAEPGVKPNSKEMSIKRRLAELESNRRPTSEDIKEMKRLKSELATGVSVDVAPDAPAIPLSPDAAEQVVDEPMINSLTELVGHHSSNGRTGLLSKIHGAFAREAFNQGNEYQKETHDNLEITDDSGKTYELKTGYIPTEFENIITPQYSDEQWLSDNALSAIQGNTARVLGGIHEGTLLGQFRKDLNEDLLTGADIDREQRAKMMYMALYKMSMTYQEDLESNKKALNEMTFDNPKHEQMFIKDIERDTQVLGMLDSYKIFDHLSNMIRLGRQFKNVVERLKTTDDNDNQLPELDIATTQKIENEAIDLANEYDREAMHVWNFITRTIYMDKENLAKLQAAGLGMNIGKVDASNETRLMQEDRDEVARVVVNKINNNARWYDSPVMAVNGQNMVEAEIGEGDKVGQTKINDNAVRKLSDNPGKVGRVVDETISANALAGFLSRRAMTFVTEMGKLDSITGHRRDAQFEQGELKSKQDFTQRSDFAWFVRNWFEKARISHDVLEEEDRDGMSRVDRAILKLESYFSGPGSILWSKPDGQNMLANKVSNTALSLSLLNKYANVAFNANKGKKTSIDELLAQSSKLITDYSDELKASVGYDNATPEQKAQIDEALQQAIEIHSGQAVAGHGSPTLKDLFVSNFSQVKNANDDNESGDESDEATTVGKELEFRPYNARQLSLAKGLAKLQVANDSVISELIKNTSNMNFVDEDGKELRFGKAKLAAYIAQDICKELTDSIEGVSQSGSWTIVPLSPMQIELGLSKDVPVTRGMVVKYINQRLDDYESIIQSQFVPQTMTELNTETPAIPQELNDVLNMAYKRILAFVQNGLIGDGKTDKTKKAAEMMAAMHAQASSVQHTLEHEFRSKVNDTNASDEELDSGYIRPALSNVSPKDIQHAVAHGMKQWANGEMVWPIVTTQLGKFGKFGKLYEAQQKSLPEEERDTYILKQKYAQIEAAELQGVKDKDEIKRIKEDIAQAKAQELNEIKYRFFKSYVEPTMEPTEMEGGKNKKVKGNQNKKSDKAQLGYGSDKIADIKSHALRDPELASDVHSLISKQLGQNIQNLQNAGSGKYSPSAYTSAVSATQRGHILDVKAANPNAYSQMDEPPMGNTGWTHRYFGTLNLDPAHPIYKRMRGYALNRRSNRGGVEEPLTQPSAIDTAVQPVQTTEINSQIAIAVERLIRYATKLDAKGKFAEADLIDSLVHKLEVMV